MRAFSFAAPLALMAVAQAAVDLPKVTKQPKDVWLADRDSYGSWFSVGYFAEHGAPALSEQGYWPLTNEHEEYMMSFQFEGAGPSWKDADVLRLDARGGFSHTMFTMRKGTREFDMRRLDADGSPFLFARVDLGQKDYQINNFTCQLYELPLNYLHCTDANTKEEVARYDEEAGTITFYKAVDTQALEELAAFMQGQKILRMVDWLQSEPNGEAPTEAFRPDEELEFTDGANIAVEPVEEQPPAPVDEHILRKREIAKPVAKEMREKVQKAKAELWELQGMYDNYMTAFGMTEEMLHHDDHAEDEDDVSNRNVEPGHDRGWPHSRFVKQDL